MINLAEEWRKLDAHRRKPDAQEHWDRRAKTYSFKDTPEAYLRSFIDKAGICGDERVLDMGCGTGSLALALADMGCSVVAADFSQGMLERLQDAALGRGVLWGAGSVVQNTQGSSCFPPDASALTEYAAFSPAPCRAGGRNAERADAVPLGKILPLHMSWEDDWEQFGLGENVVDVALASRSLITHDLEDSLRKLSRVARKRVCVTVGTGISPRVDMRVARAMGLTLERHNDALFVFGIASDLGYEPTVSYIHSPRIKTYRSPDEAYSSLLRTKNYVADNEKQVSEADCEANLKAFLAEHLIEMVEDGIPCWMLDEPRIVPWAFIGWDA